MPCPRSLLEEGVGIPGTRSLLMGGYVQGVEVGMSKGVGTHSPAATVRTVAKRAIRNLLECFLVYLFLNLHLVH